MSKKLLVFGVVIVAAILLGLYFVQQYNDTDRVPVSLSTETQTQETSNLIRLAAIGDNIPHDTINLRARTDSGYDYTKYYQNIQPALNSADLVFCNQEAPSAGEQFPISGYPSFNAPAAFPRDLSKIGCNIINLANNHIADKGEEGTTTTLQTWQNYKTKAIAGANGSTTQQNKISFFNASGMRFSFIAFTDLTNNTAIPPYAVNMFSETLVTNQLKKARRNSDFVIVSAHWGTEDQQTISPSQKKWAQVLASNGADLVIGTGPHVLQTAEKINDTTVLYSLGNMLSSQLKLRELIGGVVVIDINTNSKKIESLGFMPTLMHMEWTAAQEDAEDLLARTNVNIYPLANANQYLQKTRFSTTAEIELGKVDRLLNKNIKIRMIDIADF